MHIIVRMYGVVDLFVVPLPFYLVVFTCVSMCHFPPLLCLVSPETEPILVR